jgi:hypothetical protein
MKPFDFLNLDGGKTVGKGGASLRRMTVSR